MWSKNDYCIAFIAYAVDEGFNGTSSPSREGDLIHQDFLCRSEIIVEELGNRASSVIVTSEGR